MIEKGIARMLQHTSRVTLGKMKRTSFTTTKVIITMLRIRTINTKNEKESGHSEESL